MNYQGHPALAMMPFDRPHTISNKAIVDYTSPAQFTPVTPFPVIGDAAYRQRAGRGPRHGHGQHAQKLVKIARVVPEISSRTDRQTNRQTYSSQYFATAPAGEVLVFLIDLTLVPFSKYDRSSHVFPPSLCGPYGTTFG